MTLLDSIPHAIAEHVSHRRGNQPRWWVLTGVACLVLAIGYLAVAALIAFVTATAAGAHVSVPAVFAAALPGWLAAHQVPLSITGAPLSALPLTPTVLVMLLVAAASSRLANRHRLRRPSQAGAVVLVMGLTHAVFGTVVAIVLHGPVGATPIEAFLGCGLVAATAAVIGTARRCGLVYPLWERSAPEVWAGLWTGLLAVAAVIGAGAAVVFGGMCVSFFRFVEQLGGMGTVGDFFGGLAVILLYLANAVVAAWGFAAGTGLSIGGYAVSPFGMTGAALPDFPLFAVLPSTGPAVWWPLACALPLLVGARVGWDCRNAHGRPVGRLRAVAAAALVTALVVLLLGLLVGGRLGGGRFDPVSVRPVLLAVATFGWVALPGGLVAWLAGADEDQWGEAPFADAEPLDSDADQRDGAADEDTEPDEAGDDVRPEQDFQDDAELESDEDLESGELLESDEDLNPGEPLESGEPLEPGEDLEPSQGSRSGGSARTEVSEPDEPASGERPSGHDGRTPDGTRVSEVDARALTEDEWDGELDRDLDLELEHFDRAGSTVDDESRRGR